MLTCFTIGLYLSAGAALAQEPSSAACPAGDVEVDLGFSGFDCVACNVHTAEGWVEFGAEPGVMGVSRHGAAAGLLRDGDRIVAVDGDLITSRKAGLRLGHARVGDTVLLTVRRDGELHDVKIVAGARCASDREDDEAVEPVRPSSLRGRLGLALQCRGPCSGMRDEEGRWRWSYSDYPSIVEIEPGGPAAQAGIVAGDLLVSVDGSPITSTRGGARLGLLHPGEPIELELQRDDQRIRVVATAR